jgi:hypothetical protein
MPYALSLQTYCKPEFFAQPPESWQRRLREVSPIVENTSHLRLRYFAPHDFWYWPDQGQWMLYACTPKRMIHPERAKQYDKHWSELSLDPEKEYNDGAQQARKAVVSSYQHFMWHTCGVEAKPFLILQGDSGGTPAKYEEREKRYLDASGCISEPPPLGFFPACPFDERTVRRITERDRLLQACNRYDELEKMNKPEYLRQEDEAAERVFRETYLDTMAVMLRPNIEFIQSAMGRRWLDSLPPAPAGTADAVAQYKDAWIEHGKTVGTGRVAPQRAKQFAVR